MGVRKSKRPELVSVHESDLLLERQLVRVESLCSLLSPCPEQSLAHGGPSVLLGE